MVQKREINTISLRLVILIKNLYIMYFRHLMVALTALLVLGALPSKTSAQGIAFFHGSWAEALEEAKKENKPIFVDGYAEWCGPCKRLSRSVFPLPEVGEYFNKHFVNVKMDMEKGDGPSFRRKYPLSAYPTLFFIQPDGELIKANRGAPRDANSLISLAKNALGSYNPASSVIQKYEQGDKSYETMLELVTNLNKGNQPSLKYANEYLRSQNDLTTEKNRRFIFEALTQLDSKIFDLYLEDKSGIDALFSKEEILNKIKGAANKTIANAKEFYSPDLKKVAIDNLGKLYPKEATLLETTILVEEKIETDDLEGLTSTVNKAVKKSAISISSLDKSIGHVLRQHHENIKGMEAASKWSLALAQKTNKTIHWSTYGAINKKLGNKKAALKAYEKCLSLCKKEGKPTHAFERVIQDIKSK